MKWKSRNSSQVGLLRTNYQTYAEKKEQARVGLALDEAQVTNLKVVQPASFVAKAVSPKVGLVLFLGLFVSTFGGLGVALLCEFFDHSLKSQDHVELQLGLPVLQSIPYTPRRALVQLIYASELNAQPITQRTRIHDHCVALVRHNLY